MSAGTAGAASLPIAAIALPDIMRTFGSGSFRAAVSAGSAGSAFGPSSRRAIAARPRVTGSGSDSAFARSADAARRARRGSWTLRRRRPGRRAGLREHDVVHAEDVAARGLALAEAHEGQRVAALRQARPADLVVRADVGLERVAVELRLRPHVRARLVLELRARPAACRRAAPCRRRSPSPAPSGCRPRSRRPRARRRESSTLRARRPRPSKRMTSLDQKRSGKTEALPFSALTSASDRLDLDLQRVALRQPRRAVGHGRLVLRRCPPGTRTRRSTSGRRARRRPT